LHPDGHASFPFASDGIRTIYRVSPEEVREDAAKVWAILHPDDLASIADSIQKSAQELTLWNHEYRVKFDDNTVRWLLGSAKPERETDGSVLWHGFITDITERKKSEEALKDSEFRWKFAIEGSGDGVWDWNIQTDEAQYSKRWKEMLGYSDEDILPTNDEWSSRVHPDDQLYVKNAMQAYLEGMTEIYVVEYRLRCKDDSYKWILGRGMIVSRSEDGKPLRMIGTHTDISERKHLELELTRQAHLDYLTGLSNRRHFMEQAEVEMSRAVRYDTPLSLLMIDIDLFKNVNDTYGHQVGDIVLQALSKICQETLRQVDVAGRLGGEEFAIILPETDSNEALEVAERLRTIVAKTEVAIPVGLPIHFRVSIGVTTLGNKDINIDTLLNQADKALYEAKETGRNKVCVG
jgi:diguanylate cyclase (GGDEF)-like protein/PAS domain S-box-containing protein